MWPLWVPLTVGASAPHLVLMVGDTSGPWWGNVAAAAMVIEWLCLAGAIAVVVLLPEALLYRFVGRMSTGRALWSSAGANFAGGAAYALTFAIPGAFGWGQWLAGLGALLSGELVVAWLTSRSLPSRHRLLLVLAAANAALYAVVVTLARLLV